MEWTKKKEIFSDSLKNLAIEIYNKTEFNYEPARIITRDLDNGLKQERDGVVLFDKVNKTNYIKEYDLKDTSLPFEKDNEYMHGTRDFGDSETTFDLKTSTCKNIFDKKRVVECELGYVFQQNGYKYLYGTPNLYLVNVLMSKGFSEIEKLIATERYYNFEKSDEYFDELQNKYEEIFTYDTFHDYSDESRIQIKEIPIIEDFEEMLIYSVNEMNDYIEEEYIPILNKKQTFKIN